MTKHICNHVLFCDKGALNISYESMGLKGERCDHAVPHPPRSSRLISGPGRYTCDSKEYFRVCHFSSIKEGRVCIEIDDEESDNNKPVQDNMHVE